MKKFTRKLLVAILALTLALAMPLTAFANTTISVELVVTLFCEETENYVVGQEVRFYRDGNHFHTANSNYVGEAFVNITVPGLYEFSTQGSNGRISFGQIDDDSDAIVWLPFFVPPAAGHPTSRPAGHQIGILFNNEYLQPDVEPIIRNNRTLIPVRFVAEALGLDVDWDGETRTVTLESEEQDISVTLVIGQYTATVTDQAGTRTVTSDVASLVHQDRTMLPLRLIAELFGAEVDWDGSTQTAIVNTPN